MTDIKSLLQKALNLKIFYFFFIISLGVMVPLLSLNGNFHVAGGDMTHPEFNISTSIERGMHIWQDSKGLGVSESSTIPALFPYYPSIWFLEFLGFSAGATQKILLIIVFALSGLAMFYMMMTLFPEKKYLHAAFIAALFYLFNFFNLQMFWQPYFNYALAYAMTPLLLGVYAKGLETGNRKYLCYFILISFLNASSALNYALIAIQLLILFSYTLWTITHLKDRAIILIKRILWYGTAFFAANSFWLIPTIIWYFTAAQSYGQGSIIAHNLEGQISLTGQYGIPINTFRLWGFPWFFKDGLEWSYPIHILYTQNALLILLSFIPALLAFLAIILMRKKKEWHKVLFFSILLLIGFFMMKGTAPPFGNVFRWLLDNSGSFLCLFKNPFNKSGMIAVLSSAVLIGLAVNEITTRFKRKSTLLIILFLAGLTLSGLIFPYWTGEAVRSRVKVNIPSAYSEVSQYLNLYDSSLKVLPLPLFTVNNFKVYKWGYSGAGVDQYFIQNPLIDRSFEIGSLETEKAIKLLREAINIEDAARVVSLCRQYGIGWIVYHNDVDSTFYNEDLHLDSTMRVLNTSFFVHEKSFGELELYKIADSIPQIYSPNRIVVYPSDDEPLNSYHLVDNKIKKPMFVPSANLAGFDDENLVKNFSFEDEPLWSGVADVTPSMPGNADMLGIRSADATDGNYSLQLSTKNHIAAVAVKIDNFTTFSNYRLSFDYKYISGYVPRFAIFQEGSGLSDPAMELPKNSKWQHFELTFRPQANTTNLFLYLYAQPVPGEETVILYDNVKVNKSRSAVKIEFVDIPKVNFTNISSTKYIINISEATAPYYLVLSESFNSNWKAYIVDEDKPISFWNTLFGNSLPEENHLKVNGYSNAWRIKKSGNYTIVIEFWLQRFFYLGLIVSSITLFGCLGYLGYDFAKRRKCKNNEIEKAYEDEE